MCLPVLKHEDLSCFTWEQKLSLFQIPSQAGIPSKAGTAPSFEGTTKGSTEMPVIKRLHSMQPHASV